MRAEDYVYATCMVLILFCIVGLISSVNKERERQDFLISNHCALNSSEKTGKKIYCGKACFRPEVRETYQCSFGEHVITH